MHPDESSWIDLFHGDATAAERADLLAHLAGCPACAAKREASDAFLGGLDLPVPDGGTRAARTALRLAGLPGALDPAARPDARADEILTPEEVADWLKVPVESVDRMLHALPHFVFDGQVRIRKEALLHFIDGLERGRPRVAQPDAGSFFLRRDVI